MIEAITGILTWKAITLLSLVVLSPVALFIGSKTKAYFKNKKKALIASISKIQDKDIQKLVKDMIEQAEIVIGSGKGRAKFKLVKKELLKSVPEIARPLADAFIQGIFDGMVESGEINKAT